MSWHFCSKIVSGNLSLDLWISNSHGPAMYTLSMIFTNWFMKWIDCLVRMVSGTWTSPSRCTTSTSTGTETSQSEYSRIDGWSFEKFVNSPFNGRHDKYLIMSKFSNSRVGSDKTLPFLAYACLSKKGFSLLYSSVHWTRY